MVNKRITNNIGAGTVTYENNVCNNLKSKTSISTFLVIFNKLYSIYFIYINISIIHDSTWILS